MPFRPSHLRWASLPLAASALWLAHTPAHAAANPVPASSIASDIAAHHAHYTLTLQSARGDVTAAAGTMDYQVTDACDGWATSQNLDMMLTNRDGQDVHMLSDYTTWESKDGLKMTFHTKQTTDTAVTSDLAGSATLKADGSGGSVHFTSPTDSTKTLPAGTVFPTDHTVAILTAAAAGKKILSLPLFDGTSGDGVQDTSVAIANWSAGDPSKWPDLANMANGRVHVAFFDHTKNAQEPNYEVGIHYWVNGIADQLNMDFGDFVMLGRLDALKVAPPHGC